MTFLLSRIWCIEIQLDKSAYPLNQKKQEKKKKTTSFPVMNSGFLKQI